MKDSEVIFKCFLTYYGMTTSRGFFLGGAYQLQTHTFHVLPESIADHELKRNLLGNVDDSLMNLRFLSTESFFKGFCTNLRTRALSRSSYQGTTQYSSKFGD